MRAFREGRGGAKSRTGLVVVKEAECLDGLLLRVARVHLVRHHRLERLERDGARAVAVRLSDHAPHLLALGLEAHGTHGDLELCATAAQAGVRARRAEPRVAPDFHRAAAAEEGWLRPRRGGDAPARGEKKRGGGERWHGSEKRRGPSESMVPESSVSNSLNASRISSSWSLVNEGVDIGLAVPATTPTHARAPFFVWQLHGRYIINNRGRSPPRPTRRPLPLSRRSTLPRKHEATNTHAGCAGTCRLLRALRPAHLQGSPAHIEPAQADSRVELGKVGAEDEGK